MAIELLSGPQADIKSAGALTLPTNFNTKLHAAKWVLKGNAVQAAAEREFILGTRMTADGWAVWKDGEEPTKGKPHTAHLSKGEYILLFRPRAIQDAVNAIYGNVGKKRMMSEKKGETMGGEPVRDPGLLGERDISKVTGSEGLGGEDGDVQLNKVDFGDQENVQSPTLVTDT